MHLHQADAVTIFVDRIHYLHAISYRLYTGTTQVLLREEYSVSKPFQNSKQLNIQLQLSQANHNIHIKLAQSKPPAVHFALDLNPTRATQTSAINFIMEFIRPFSSYKKP